MVGIVRYPIDGLGIARTVLGFWGKTRPNPPGFRGGQGHGTTRPKARWGGALLAKAHPAPPRVTLYPEVG